MKSLEKIVAGAIMGTLGLAATTFVSATVYSLFDRYANNRYSGQAISIAVGGLAATAVSLMVWAAFDDYQSKKK